MVCYGIFWSGQSLNYSDKTWKRQLIVMNESWPWCEVYEIIHIWTAVVDESEEWSSQWIFQFKQLERRSLKHQDQLYFLKSRIYSITRPERFWSLKVGAYSRLGAYQIFNIFSKYGMFILQQNNKW